MYWLKLKWCWIKSLWYKFFGQSYYAKICGHTAKLFTRVKVLEEGAYLTLKPGFDYCPDCLSKMAIRCAWCGRSIVAGEPITLYSPSDKNSVIPAWAVVYSKKPLRLVGCMRFDCADSGIDRSGFWVEPGKVYRVASPMEQCLAANDVVICNDLRDISQATPLQDSGEA